MDFINAQVDPGSIPEAKFINWQPIEKDYLKVLRLEWAIHFIRIAPDSGHFAFFYNSFSGHFGCYLINKWLVIDRIPLFFYPGKIFSPAGLCHS